MNKVVKSVYLRAMFSKNMIEGHLSKVVWEAAYRWDKVTSLWCFTEGKSIKKSLKNSFLPIFV